MNSDHKRTYTRERFPPIPPGRTFLSSSTESVERERPISRAYTQKPCPPAGEPTKRQRPYSGRSSVSLKEEIKRQRPDSSQSIKAAVAEEMKRQGPETSQYIISAVVEEIKRQRPDSGKSLKSAVVEEFKRQRPGNGQPFTLVREEIKRQTSADAISITSASEEIKCQMPECARKLTSSPEKAEAFKMSGQINTAAELDNKAVRSSDRMEILQEQAKREEDKLKSFSAQQFRNCYSPTATLSANSADLAANRAPTPVVVDVKAERKRRRREKKEKEARRLEEARKKEQDKLDAERLVAEISRNRSMFNGNRETLPAIGSQTAEVKFYIGKLPRIQEHDILAPTPPENNAVDVIRKHETQVRTTAFLKEISQDYINASAELMEPFRRNEAVEIIESHEDEFGRAYTTSYLTRNYGSSDKPSSARSRCSPGASRWGTL